MGGAWNHDEASNWAPFYHTTYSKSSDPGCEEV